MDDLRREQLVQDHAGDEIGERAEAMDLRDCGGCRKYVHIDELRKGDGYCIECVKEYGTPDNLTEQAFNSKTIDRISAIVDMFAVVYFACRFIESII